MLDFAFPHLLQEIFSFFTSLPLCDGSNDEVSIVMLLDFLKLSKELSLRRRVNLRTSGFVTGSGNKDLLISSEFELVWFGLEVTVMLMSSIDSWSGGFSTVLIPFDAVFSITCQFSSFSFTADVPTSSKDDESELELLARFVLFWLFAQPLGPALPSKMLWRFSEISIISSSEQSQSSFCWRFVCDVFWVLLLLEGVGVGMLGLTWVELCWRLLLWLGGDVGALADGGDCGENMFDLAVEGRGCCVVGCRVCWFDWLKQVVFWKSTKSLI